MTIDEAKALQYHDYIHHVTRKNADGTPMRARVTSVKTWKTRPNEVRIGYKRGMYETGHIREYELSNYEVGYGS